VREFLIVMAKSGLVGGVYLWINKIAFGNKMYVGSSVNLYNRIRRYLSLGYIHGVIGQALSKYGLDGFILVLFFVPNATSSLVLALEQGVFDDCTCAYNINPTAKSPAGVKRSEETGYPEKRCLLLRKGKLTPGTIKVNPYTSTSFVIVL
jgi:group I intron endonuclease